MFTGIVEEVGTVREIKPGKLVINAKKVTWGTNLGDSIAVNGCDLTAVYFDEDGFLANVIEETYKRTNLGDLKVGDPRQPGARADAGRPRRRAPGARRNRAHRHAAVD